MYFLISCYNYFRSTAELSTSVTVAGCKVKTLYEIIFISKTINHLAIRCIELILLGGSEGKKFLDSVVAKGFLCSIS